MTSQYDTDFYQWTQTQAAALAAGHVGELDLANLAEEIESLGRSERRALQSALEIVLIHLLKLGYAHAGPEPRRGWRISARGGRKHARRTLEEQPSLRRELPALLEVAWRYATEDAHDDLTDHDGTHAPFPESCPWTVAQVLDGKLPKPKGLGFQEPCNVETSSTPRTTRPAYRRPQCSDC